MFPKQTIRIFIAQKYASYENSTDPTSEVTGDIAALTNMASLARLWLGGTSAHGDAATVRRAVR